MQKVNIAFVSKPENLERVRKALGQSRLIGVDTETLGLDALTKEIRTLQVSTALETFVIDLRTAGFDNTRAALLDVLLDPGKVKIFQNAKFDLQFLHLYLGFPLGMPSLFDTQIASALINGGAREDNGAPVSHSLQSIAKRYLNFDMEKRYQKVSWDGSLFQEQLIYAGLDSHILIPLYQLMSKNIKLNQLEKAAKLEFDCIEATAHIELSGIKLDRVKWLEASREFAEQNVGLEKELREVLGYSVNLNSPQQVKEVFRDRLGVSVESLNKDYLKTFCDEYEPKPDMFGALPPVDPRDLISKYSLWKKNDKASGIYGADFFKHINPKTGRIHSSFKQLETDTARYSSTSPNIQNVPHDTAYRHAFVPEEGNKFAIFDYSQVELRVLADVAKIKKWIDAFKHGDDLHTINAMGAFGLTEAEVTSDYRSKAKIIGFGSAFGMMAAGYMRRVNLMSERKINKTEAERDMKGYYKAIPEFTVWLNSQVEYFKQYNLVRSGSGRMRVLDRWATSEQELHMAKQASRNFPIQSTAADILKTALVSFMKVKDTDTRIVNIVHDEVVIETIEAENDAESKLLAHCMESAGKEYVHDVEITVEGKVGVDRWEK